MRALSAWKAKETEHPKLTLISISLDANMVVDDHDLNMTISLLLARVDGPAHIFGCKKRGGSQLNATICFR